MPYGRGFQSWGLGRPSRYPTILPPALTLRNLPPAAAPTTHESLIPTHKKRSLPAPFSLQYTLLLSCNQIDIIRQLIPVRLSNRNHLIPIIRLNNHRIIFNRFNLTKIHNVRTDRKSVV